MKDSASRLGTYTDGCRIRFLTNLSLRVFIFIAFPLSEKSFKVEHAEAARFYVFLRFNHDSGRKNAGMIGAPFSSCLSSGNREPVYECARPSSIRPACTRPADVVLRGADLSSRTPVHRGHGARHSIDACGRREVLPTKARRDGPGGYGEHVQVLNQAEVRNSRLRMSAGRPTQGQPARYFREERF